MRDIRTDNASFILTTEEGSKGSRTKTRSSNIELFRIIVMMLIIAHHYVVNSGLMSIDGPMMANPLSFKTFFLLLFGMWGKTGINCFVLITGFFMCKSKITFKKFLKLILEYYFYSIIIYAVFLITGYQRFSLKELIFLLLPFKSVSDDFMSCYLLFFLFIPFLNILIRNMTEKQHGLLVALCSFVYVILGTIPKINVRMNYVSWFIVLYFIASYIRLYPKEKLNNTKFTGYATLIFIICAIGSVVALQWLSVVMNTTDLCYKMVSDSNKIFAVLTAVSAFCFFKNLKIKNNTFINSVAASTFGVLIIHANSDAMRQWLWKDVLNNVGMYGSKWIVVHAVLSVVCIFVLCALIDMGRRKFIEAPFFKWIDKKTVGLKEK